MSFFNLSEGRCGIQKKSRHKCRRKKHGEILHNADDKPAGEQVKTMRGQKASANGKVPYRWSGAEGLSSSTRPRTPFTRAPKHLTGGGACKTGEVSAIIHGQIAATYMPNIIGCRRTGGDCGVRATIQLRRPSGGSSSECHNVLRTN